MPTDDDAPRRTSLVEALHAYLGRSTAGPEPLHSQADGETEFACECDENLRPYGCAWCDDEEWTEADPQDVA
jgi:hypothetical protein